MCLTMYRRRHQLLQWFPRTNPPCGWGTSTPQRLEGHFFSSPPLLGQSQNPLPSTPQVPGAALVDAGEKHSATIILGMEDQGGGGLTVPQTPFSVPFLAPESKPMKSERTPPSSSSAARNHAELISSLSVQGDKLYKELLSSYEAASGSSSRASQLERELEALKQEKAHEEGFLQCRLKNLAGENFTVQEKYAAGARRIEGLRAELESS
ncbi:hypothetical protein LIER_05185 [Lithospermum erythrorhizon]|uniref:Uncharacterized protein n=1 Tax=Lithospermum erythrorhizon TaxID=34254 RepID=A0AAV3NZS5_LITER